MTVESRLLQQLIEALCCMPGVGKKSAKRIVYRLLQHGRDEGLHLAGVLDKAMQEVGHCQQCRTFTEQSVCSICSDPHREEGVLCVVEGPSDIDAIEETDYKGLYFVLMGRLSPLDGIGPVDLGLDHLAKRLEQDKIGEIILATNTTIEGEATAHFIAEMVRPSEIKLTRIAYGVPMGGELEYIDSSTIAYAFSGRKEY